MAKVMGGKTYIQTDRCHRCGGLMVPENVLETALIDWRCVSCGERIDHVILTHRRETHTGRKGEVHSDTKEDSHNN